MAKPRSRANGEGTIFKRKRDGKYVAELMVGRDTEGKPQMIRLAADTRKEVQAWLTERLNEKNKGVLVKPSKESLGDFLKNWIEKVVVHDGGEESTHQLYRNMLNWYIAKHPISTVPVGEVKVEHIHELFHWMQSGPKPKSARTVQLTRTVLKRGLDEAVTRGYLSRNPASLAKGPKVKKRKHTILEPDLIMRFLREAMNDRYYAALLLQLTLGLRRGELLGLRWSAVDMDNSVITINHVLKIVDNKIQFGDPKTEESNRVIALPQIAQAALIRWREQQTAELEPLGITPELVFTTTIGTPVHPNNLRTRSLHPILAQAGLPRMRPHELRHSFATWMLDEGVAPHVLQTILGHKHVSVTLGIYGHVLKRQKKEAAVKVDSFLAALPETEQKKAPPMGRTYH